VRAGVSAALALVHGHPRHLGLFAVVAGLLLGPLSPLAVLVATCGAAAVAGRPGLALLAVAGILGGAALADARLAVIDGGRLASFAVRPVTARAVLIEPLRPRAFGGAAARVRLLGGPARGEAAVLRVPARLLRPRRPAIGDILGVRGRIVPLARFEAFQRRRGAHAAIAATEVVTTGERRGGPAGALDAVRRRAETGVTAGMRPPEAALALGMVLGQDDDIDQDVQEEFQRSGLAHLLAVSGQNVMLLALLVLGVSAVLGIGLRARLLTALALVAVYVPLTGAGPSIQRAGVMGAAGLVAALSGRPASRWYALGLAAAVTLALNPHAAAEPGWQLSFAAVAGLMALAPSWRHRLAAWGLPGPVADAAAVTLAATVATAPLLALHFGSVSLASLPANLLAAPAVAPIMWLGMVAAAAGQVEPALALPLNALNGPLLAYVEWVAHVAAGAPLSALPLRLGGPVGLAAAYAVPVAAWLALRRWWRRVAPHIALRRRSAGPRRTLALAATAAVAAVAAGPPLLAAARSGPGAGPRSADELVVSFLDIGQGDATLLQRAGAAILVDTGPPDGPILRRLDAAGVRRLDVLVLTHAQADHEGAALAVIRRFRPRLVLDGGAGWPAAVERSLPAWAASVGARRIDARAGQSLTVGGMRLRVLWPPPPGPAFRPEGDPNQRAVVAHVAVGAFDLLLTADAESDVTGPLALPEVEALKVAHHGSADPGLPALLARLHVRVAAIEVGRHNSYGHPAPSTLAALRAVQTVVRTDRDGTVRLRVRGGAMRVERGAS
jgi:competence protein ComEC